MAANRVNKAVKKLYTLRPLGKKEKHIGTGDGGLITDKTRQVLRK